MNGLTLKKEVTMSLVKFSPSTLFPSSVLPGLMENFFGRDMFDLTNRALGDSTLPAVNIRETSNDFLVEVAAPGMKKDDFKVTLENNLLTISSQKEEQNEEQEGNYTRQEFRYHSFSRSFGMPSTADSDRIKAKYHDGVLSIQIPKKEEAKQKPPKQIQIS
jgi:HSP20 family protein